LYVIQEQTKIECVSNANVRRKGVHATLYLAKNDCSIILISLIARPRGAILVIQLPRSWASDPKPSWSDHTLTLGVEVFLGLDEKVKNIRKSYRDIAEYSSWASVFRKYFPITKYPFELKTAGVRGARQQGHFYPNQIVQHELAQVV
jgi:hypothetical protein